MDQLVQMNENEQDLQWQRPRSHSLPNMTFKESDDAMDDSDLEEGDKPSKTRSRYVFNLERDFGYETQEYLSLRREIRKRKLRLLKGELTPEELGEGKARPADGQDARTAELSAKQRV